MDYRQTTTQPACTTRTTRSGASRGVVIPVTGISACPMCSRVCKGDRGLQVHLRTCRKRSGSSVPAGTTSSTEAVVCLPQPSSSSSEVVVCLPRPSSNVTVGGHTASQDVAALLPQTASSSRASRRKRRASLVSQTHSWEWPLSHNQQVCRKRLSVCRDWQATCRVALEPATLPARTPVLSALTVRV